MEYQISETDLKALLWIAWRNGSIGSGDSVEEDQMGFKEWWEDDAVFLLNNRPIEPSPNYE